MMIKIVLDANVFVSAVIKSPSNPARILELVKERKVFLYRHILPEEK
jgi:predicted nucleic acid-binding protein